jgi:hypothetical protein
VEVTTMPSALPPLVLSAALVCAAVGAAGAADWVVPPPTHPLAEPLPAKPAVRKGADFIDLENQHVLLRLAWRPGLVLERLRNKHTARECLPLGASRLFAVLPDDAGHAWVGSDRFKVEEVVGTADPGVGAQAQVTVELTCAELSLAATLSVTVGPSEETLWRLRMRNSGATARKLCLCFPMLERTVLGEDSADDYYFFPMVGAPICPMSWACPMGRSPARCRFWRPSTRPPAAASTCTLATAPVV